MTDTETVSTSERGDAEGRRFAPGLTFLLGDEVIIRGTELSPDARWLLVVTETQIAREGPGRAAHALFTESGYEEPEKERLRVGRNPPAPQSCCC